MGTPPAAAAEDGHAVAACTDPACRHPRCSATADLRRYIVACARVRADPRVVLNDRRNLRAFALVCRAVGEPFDTDGCVRDPAACLRAAGL